MTPDPDALQRSSQCAPIVHPDRRVTLSVLAPLASRVDLVSGALAHELGGPQALRRQDDGVWTITIGPLRPDLYDYGFAIDGGLRMVDTLNPDIEQLRWGSLSQIEVPGDEPALYQFHGAPCGTVHCEHYASDALGGLRRFLVYTPAGYDSSRETPYPVLYLLHGSGLLEDSWYTTGRMHLICDNLIHQGLVEPVVVVMPFGHHHRAMQPGEHGRSGPDYGAVETSFFNEIIPRSEAAYHIGTTRSRCALAGLSMGSNQARIWGLDRPVRFCSVGIFSNRRNTEELTDMPTFHAAADAALPQHCFLAMGTGEDHHPGWQALGDLLEQRGLRVSRKVYPGNHSFVCWRRCLADYLQETFPGRSGAMP